MRPRRGASADPLDRGRFPVDPWRLVESTTAHDDLGVTETLFTVANGYLGMRGNPEEGRDALAHGTFVNGFHETWPIRHAEAAFGFARTGQTIVNVPDAKLMKLYVDDEPLILGTADLEHYERSLDFRDGVLRRSLVWRTPSGKRVRVDSTRMVSMTQRHLAVLTLEVTMLDGRRADRDLLPAAQPPGRRGRVPRAGEAMGEGADPRKAGRLRRAGAAPASCTYAHEDRMLLGYRCAQSRMTIAVAADHHLETDDAHEVILRERRGPRQDGLPGRGDRGQHGPAGEAGRLPHLPRRAGARAVRPLRPHPRPGRPARRRALPRRAARLVRPTSGRAATSRCRRRRARALQQAIRFNLFSLAQASARADQQGVPAKGVTGSGYEGHYFWDTEVYVVPFLTYTQPRRRPQPAALPHPDAAGRARAGPARWRRAARCSRGARSTARRPRRTTPPAPPRCTSTPTSPTR